MKKTSFYQPETSDPEVQFGINYVQQICGNHLVEPEVEAAYKDLYFGFVDALCEIEDTIHVFDPKTGWTDANHYKPQLEGYALGLMDKRGFKKAVCHLVMWEQKKVVSWDTNLTQAKALVMEILASHQNPDSKPVANKYCQWCANLMNCEAVNREVSTVLASGPKLPTHFNTSEELGSAMHVRKLLVSWCDGVKKLADINAAEGGSLPGWKIGRIKGREKLTDILAAWEAVKDHLSPEEFLSCCTLNLSKLKKKFPNQDFPAADLVKRGDPYYRFEPARDLISETK